jgi:hypothetical protein
MIRAYRKFKARCSWRAKLGVEQHQVETNAWGQTFSLRILAIRLAWQRGLLNRVILEDETTRLHAWLQTYASPEA